MFQSIRQKLLYTLIGSLIIFSLIAVVATFVSAKAEFNRFLDFQLKDTALVTEQILKASNTNEINQLQEFRRDDRLEIILQIFDSQEKKYVFQSDSTSQHILPLVMEPGFSTDSFRGKTWRIFSVPFKQYIIVVGQDTAVLTTLAVTSAFRVLQPFLLFIPVIALAIWFLAGQSLAPLEKTARIIAKQDPQQLQPIALDQLPNELLTLVSALNRLLGRLQESMSAQARFASDAAHELRTPLTAIKLHAQLAERATTPEAKEKHFKALHEGLARGTRLVEQLLILARLDPDSNKKPFTSANLVKVISQATTQLEPVATTKGIKLTFHTPNACSIYGDEDAIYLMVTNLMDNAIRYTPQQGQISVSLEDKRDRVVISVADNGIGIPKENKERIFDRFYRVLGTKTTGTGLGLAIVKRILDLHQGSIEISEGLEGKGTTFSIFLPK